MTASLRPFLKEDLELLAEIFCASIEGLTQDDYDEEQRAAWMAGVLDDEEAFLKRLTDQLTILVLEDGDPVGFASLRGTDELDLLYVHPVYARQGYGTALADALERLAGARGATAVITNASETARPFFEKRGYVGQSRNTIIMGGEWLANTVMRKDLEKSEKLQ
jgi:putative acetyltransferase